MGEKIDPGWARLGKKIDQLVVYTSLRVIFTLEIVFTFKVVFNFVYVLNIKVMFIHVVILIITEKPAGHPTPPQPVSHPTHPGKYNGRLLGSMLEF